MGNLQRRHRLPRPRRSRPPRTHRQRLPRRTRTAQHHRPRRPANRSQPKHSRCCKPSNRPRRPSGLASSPINEAAGPPFSSATPAPGCRTATARHHGDTLSPNQLSRSLRTAVSTREIILVPHPAPRHVDSACQRGAAPDADPASPYHATPHTTMSRCARTRKVTTTSLAASNPQRRRQSVGVPTVAHRFAQRQRPGPPRLHTVNAATHRHATAPAGRATANRATSGHHRQQTRCSYQSAPERMPCYCSRAAPSPTAPAVHHPRLRPTHSGWAASRSPHNPGKPKTDRTYRHPAPTSRLRNIWLWSANHFGLKAPQLLGTLAPIHPRPLTTQPTAT